MASRSDDGEGFTIRKHKDSRPLSVALRAPAPPEGSLSLHPEHNPKLAKLWLLWYTRLEKTKSFRKPLLTPQSVGVVFFLLRTNSKLAKQWILWYIKYRKRQPPTRWVAELVKKNPLRARQSFGAVFLCP